jgi:hypothetical protein
MEQAGNASAPPSLSFAALWETIGEMEKDLDLLNQQIGGAYYWPLIRGQVFEGLCRALGFLSPSPVGTRHGRLETLASEVLPFVTQRRKSPLRIDGGFDTIVVPFMRKHHRGGRVVDIFTDSLFSEVEFGRFLVLDVGAATNLQATPGSEVRSRDYLRALALRRAFFLLPKIFPAARRERHELDGAIGRRIGRAFPLSAANFALRVAFFLAGRELARRIVERSGAKRLFIAGGHVWHGISAAAKEQGLTTVEMQHGVITPYQAAYQYPGHPVVPYVCDYLLLFGPYWASNAQLPGNMKALVVGSRNIGDLRECARSKVPRRVVALSQGTIGSKLFAGVAEAARAAPLWDFIFRPHPLESADHFRVQLARSAIGNLRISDSSESFYELLASADVQVGVYSTSLFEGMALGARTIILDLPGCEHMMGPIAMGDAILAKDAAHIARNLEWAPKARDETAYFAAPVPSVASLLSGRP